MSDQYQEVQEEGTQESQVPDVSGNTADQSDDYSDGFMAAVKGEASQQPQENNGSDQNIDDGNQQARDDHKDKNLVPEASQEEDETQKDNYKSLLGRHQRLQEELRLLKERQQIEASRPQQPPQRQQEFEKAEIPEELKDDVEAFKKQYPEYSALIELKGREGDRIRGVLSEFGASMAAMQADTLVTRLELARSKQEVTQRVSHQAAISHEQQIYAAHPDFAALEPSKKREFLEGIRGWIEEMPFREAQHWDRVFSEGSTQDTIQLFNEFKRSRYTTTQNNSKQQITNASRQQKIEDGLAVPSSARGARTGQSRPSEPDEYTSGFLAACRGR